MIHQKTQLLLLPNKPPKRLDSDRTETQDRSLHVAID